MNILTKTVCLLLLECTFLSLQGCVNAAVTGAQAMYSRYNIQSTLTDHSIWMRAEREIYLDTDRFANTNVSVSSIKGIVLITGQVNTLAQHHEIEQILKKIPGVQELHNALTLSTPTSALTRTSDSWITTKIKAKLMATEDLDPNQIKVVTENGIVYLMGIVPPDQASIAVDLARTTEGVQRVVKVFSYIHISKA